MFRQVAQVKYSKAAVGSFKNRVCRKSPNIEPELSLKWILTPFRVQVLMNIESLCVVKTEASENGSKTGDPTNANT